MNILVLTPIYPSKDVTIGETPVVHYFLKEWSKMGLNIQVVHCKSTFPLIYYWLSSMFYKTLSSKIGFVLPQKRLQDEEEYQFEGINVFRLCMKKYIPHARYSQEEIEKATQKVILFLKDKNFKPDYILAHWTNPQLELLDKFKKIYKVPTSLVMHDPGFDLDYIYKGKATKLLGELDNIGFRSDAIKREFEKKFKISAKPFYCYSGVPSEFITHIKREKIDLNKIIYVGTLIKRKYPSEIVNAASHFFSNSDFELTFVGEGSEKNKILKCAKKLNTENNVRLLGRIPREMVTKEMVNHGVFVMISKNETFGLVYLEAMAAGCITIASKNEGFDGIIKDGVNGFLCEAGSTAELESIFMKLSKMSQKELLEISSSAMETAQTLTDENAAKIYIDNIINNN